MGVATERERWMGFRWEMGFRCSGRQAVTNGPRVGRVPITEQVQSKRLGVVVRVSVAGAGLREGPMTPLPTPLHGAQTLGGLHCPSNKSAPQGPAASAPCPPPPTHLGTPRLVPNLHPLSECATPAKGVLSPRVCHCFWDDS